LSGKTMESSSWHDDVLEKLFLLQCKTIK